MADHIQDAFEIIVMSLAIGMDAFSLAIGIGLSGVSRRKALQFSSLIGLFHVVFTLCGFYIGLLLGEFLGQLAEWFGATLLIGLGLHMAYSTLTSEREETKTLTSLFMMFLLAAGVSMDALSVGFTLGLRSTAYCLVSALMFGVAGAVLSAAGIFVGKRATLFVGLFGEVLGAIILIGCGIHFLFE